MENGNEPFMTIKEMVTEIREDVKELKESVAPKIDVEDHEQRIRSLEKWRYGTGASLIAALGAAGVAVSQHI